MHVIIQLSFANSDEIIEQLNQGKRLSDIFLEIMGMPSFRFWLHCLIICLCRKRWRVL